MNWISNYVRPKINSLFSRREMPENLWVKCDECGTMLFHRELDASLQVCTNCGHHMPISPRDRFEALFDGGVFVEVAVPKPLSDPLGFRDQKKYVDRLREARKTIGEEEAMLVAEGEIARLQGGLRRAGLRLHGRLDGHVRRQRHHRRRRARGEAQGARWCCSPPPAARGCRRASSA